MAWGWSFTRYTMRTKAVALTKAPCSIGLTSRTTQNRSCSKISMKLSSTSTRARSSRSEQPKEPVKDLLSAGLHPMGTSSACAGPLWPPDRNGDRSDAT
jgi:hypothetical protein